MVILLFFDLEKVDIIGEENFKNIKWNYVENDRLFVNIGFIYLIY